MILNEKKTKRRENYTPFYTQVTQVFKELWLELEADSIGQDRWEMLEFLLQVVLYGK